MALPKGEATLEQEYDHEFGRDPIPVWDGVEPELLLWQYETRMPVEKQGVRWHRRMPLKCPARAILNLFTNEELRARDGCEKIMAAFDREYKGYTKKVSTETLRCAISRPKPRDPPERFIADISRMTSDTKKYEKAEDVEVPVKIRMRILLEHANLNEAQKDKMQTWCACVEDLATTIANLRKLDDPLYQSGTVRNRPVTAVLHTETYHQ